MDFIRMGHSLKTLRTSASQSYGNQILLVDEIPTTENGACTCNLVPSIKVPSTRYSRAREVINTL